MFQSASLRSGDDLQGVAETPTSVETLVEATSPFVAVNETVTEIVNELVNMVVENVETASPSIAETPKCRDTEIKTEQDAIPEIPIDNDGDDGDNKHSRARARAKARAAIAPSHYLGTVNLCDDDDDDDDNEVTSTSDTTKDNGKSKRRFKTTARKSTGGRVKQTARKSTGRPSSRRSADLVVGTSNNRNNNISNNISNNINISNNSINNNNNDIAGVGVAAALEAAAADAEMAGGSEIPRDKKAQIRRGNRVRHHDKLQDELEGIENERKVLKNKLNEVGGDWKQRRRIERQIKRNEGHKKSVANSLDVSERRMEKEKTEDKLAARKRIVKKRKSSFLSPDSPTLRKEVLLLVQRFVEILGVSVEEVMDIITDCLDWEELWDKTKAKEDDACESEEDAGKDIKSYNNHCEDVFDSSFFDEPDSRESATKKYHQQKTFAERVFAKCITIASKILGESVNHGYGLTYACGDPRTCSEGKCLLWQHRQSNRERVIYSDSGVPAPLTDMDASSCLSGSKLAKLCHYCYNSD